jgi:hypothetical protein
MVRLDTLKVEIPQEAVLGFNEAKTYLTSQTDCSSGLVTNFRQFKADALPIGANQIKVKEGGNWHLTLSAKVLMDDYLEGIHLNTLERALANLGSCIEIDAQALMDANPKVHRFDTTDNVPLAMLDGSTHKAIIDALAISTSNSFFDAKRHGGQRQMGIVIQGRQEAQNRLIAYAKHLDLARAKNKPFLMACNNPQALIKASSKQLRVEVNHSNHQTIKQRLNIGEVTLGEVLNSTALVNHDYLLKITNGGKQLALFNEIEMAMANEGQGFDGLRYLISQGMANLVIKSNCNIKEVQKAIELIFGERWRYHWYGRIDARGSMRGGLKYMAQQEIDRLSANQLPTPSSNKITLKLIEALRLVA